MIKSAIITGPTGGLGTALVKKLVDEDVKVYAIVRPNSKRLSNILVSDLVTVIECDIKNYESLYGLGVKADAFFHFAWDKTSVTGRDDVNCQLSNVGYTIDAVKLASQCGCKVFIGAGSQAEYGITDKPLNETTPVNPQSAYGIAKYSAGQFAKLYCKQLNIRCCWTRILSVFGVGDSQTNLISMLINTFKSGKSPDLTPCEQVWDFLYSEDAANAFYKISQSGVDGRTYCIGSGKPRKLKEYVLAVRDLINKDIEVGFGKIPYYPHQPMYLVADVTDLSSDTGWQPLFKFEDGIAKIITNLESQK
ncbi:MAG: NAD(P)-dependent oxidoreductase [Clostridiales bacterium]|nr:NAD(P)-dependent oxidoreductase [Clostridiales bacterium]